MRIGGQTTDGRVAVMQTVRQSISSARHLCDDVALAIIHSQNTCDISAPETYYLNFIARQLYIRKSGCSVLRVYYICVALCAMGRKQQVRFEFPTAEPPTNVLILYISYFHFECNIR